MRPPRSLAVMLRMAELVATAVAQSDPDLELIGLCHETVSLQVARDLIYAAAIDNGSRSQILNEALTEKITERSFELFDRISEMSATTSAGRQACARAALQHVGRSADNEIETDTVAEHVAWQLVEQLADAAA